MFQNDALQFYPTPKALAERAWAKFKNKRFSRVLEPSAGDGALIRGYEHWDREYHYRPPVDAIEIDLTKHEAFAQNGRQCGWNRLSGIPERSNLHPHCGQPAVPG